MPTVPVQGRQNQVVLQTFYLKNSRELDIKVQGYSKEEEISYNMSKFELYLKLDIDIPFFSHFRKSIGS